ncbi:AAA domain-containing protein [Trametes gibbosa]|nr:AAA domain-containing protein [Trametes gibbosa]
MLQTEGKEYCFISPYDAQRNLMEKDMISAGLKWQDKCFNVDSFQGNEKDYVIVSLVRSYGLGFLDDPRRTNVMLTRCKRGMYIVTSWDFVWKRANNTLVGRMAAAWGDEVWVNPEHLQVKEEEET